MSYLKFKPDMTNPVAVIPAPTAANTSRNASQRRAQWDDLRPVIKKLYVEEDKTLKEVMAIMKRDHGHLATVKMYKHRITKWNLDKKTKEDEAWVLLRKKLQRAAIGKQSNFRVRGKAVTMDDVLRYFKRKGILDPETNPQQHLPSTPPEFKCWTPGSSPSLESVIPNIRERADWIEVRSPQSGGAPSSALGVTQDSGTLEHLNVNQTRRIIFSNPEITSFEIPSSLLPPQSHLVAEKLFSSITTYFLGAFEGDLFETSSDGYLVNRRQEILDNSYTPDFYELCFSGLNLMNSNSFIEGRRFFSKASGMTNNILRRQHPTTLEKLFKSLAMIEICGYTQLATSLRTHICEMATVIFPEAEGHPWRELFTQLAETEESQLQFVLLQAWGCVSERFVNYLGQFHHFALSGHLDFLKAAKGSDAPQLVRDLLIRGEQELGEVDTTILYIKNAYGSALYDNGQDVEAIEVLEEVLVRCIELGGLEDMEAYLTDTITRSRFQLGIYNYNDELRLREAIRRLETKYGKSESIVLSMKASFEGRLREIGREVEAAEVKAEIDEALGPDDI